MKKGTKITLIVIASLLTIGAAFFIGADVVLSRIATREVNKVLATLPFDSASCGGITVRLFSGTAAVDDIRLSYRGAPIVQKKDTVYPGANITVDRVDIGHIFYSMLLKKQLLIHNIHIVRPQVELWMDEEHPELCFPEMPKDTTRDSVAFPLKSAELSHFHILCASMALHSIRTKMNVVVDSCSLAVHDLLYDSTFHYCDSVYRFHLIHANIITPDGLMRIDTRDVEHSDQGPLTVGKTRIANNCAKMHLGNLAKQPMTWIDLSIKHVTTSPFNPIRKALAQDLTLDNIDAEVSEMHVFRDERYIPKIVYDMPQNIMREIPVVFDIKHIEAGIDKLFIEFASTDKNVGKLDVKSIKAHVTNATNRRGATMEAKGNCKLGIGKATAGFAMTMNKECNWKLEMHAETVNSNVMNSFVRPLVGITSECMIDKLDIRYAGNSVQADGAFRMIYHGFKVEVHNDKNVPYKIITKNAKAFTTIGNALLPKSNPSSAKAAPRAYKITWKRNEYKPVPLYLFGPCIDGVKKTMLPGLYVHLQTKDI